MDEKRIKELLATARNNAGEMTALHDSRLASEAIEALADIVQAFALPSVTCTIYGGGGGETLNAPAPPSLEGKEDTRAPLTPDTTLRRAGEIRASLVGHVGQLEGPVAPRKRERPGWTSHEEVMLALINGVIGLADLVDDLDLRLGIEQDLRAKKEGASVPTPEAMLARGTAIHEAVRMVDEVNFHSFAPGWTPYGEVLDGDNAVERARAIGDAMRARLVKDLGEEHVSLVAVQAVAPSGDSSFFRNGGARWWLCAWSPVAPAETRHVVDTHDGPQPAIMVGEPMRGENAEVTRTWKHRFEVGARVYNRRRDLFGIIKVIDHDCTAAAVKYEWPYNPESSAVNEAVTDLVPDDEAPKGDGT